MSGQGMKQLTADVRKASRGEKCMESGEKQEKQGERSEQRQGGLVETIGLNQVV